MMREDWIEVELGDVASKITDGSHNPPKKQDVGLPMLSATNILDDEIVFDNYRLIDPVEFESECKRANVEPEDILLTIVGTIGRSAVVPHNIKKFTLQRSVALIKLDGLNSKYISFALRSPSIQSFFKEQSKGTAQKGIYLNTLKKITIPLAPLPEQRAIAAKIEQLFSELDNGIANLKAAKSKLEIYRQAILKQAFEESLNSVCFNLSEITNKIQIGPFGSQLHKEDYVEGGIPLINPMHIQDGQIYPSSSYSITIQKRDSLPNYILLKDDVIMGRRGEMGRCGLITKKEEGWFCGTGSLYLRPIKQKVYPIFLYYYLRSPIIKELLTGKATGTTMMNLNKTIISELPINLPSIEEQIQIVQEIETRLSVCDKLNESIDQSLEKAQALRQSILKKAFEGKLLSQDELQTCRQQPDWEPAAKLLERVKNKKSK
ncbi:restriction endonuclease subunit S [Pseudanabaena minima]|uniref:restriction endonuclease subunit S n=1 Tax=Pseudanabaena minima TaxID=890415 RepID=UPI003DA7EDEC